MATLTETQDAYERHHLRVGVINADVADVIIRLETERDALMLDNAGLLAILRQIDYVNSPEESQRLIGAARDSAHPGRELMAHVLLDIDTLKAERERDAARAELRELTQLVGAETPFGAATLAQTWYAMQTAFMGEIAQLRAELVEMRRAGTDAVMEVGDLRAALATLVRAVENAGSHFESNLPDAMQAARRALTARPRAAGEGE